MIASGDSAQYEQNLIDAGASNLLASTVSKIPNVALNFRVWLLAVVVLLSVGIIDWKFPHLFPKKIRRMRFSDEQKGQLPAILKDASDILSKVFSCPNLIEKNKSSKTMLAKVSKLRSTASALPSGNLSFSILDYCKYSDRVWTMGRYDTKDFKKWKN